MIKKNNKKDSWSTAYLLQFAIINLLNEALFLWWDKNRSILFLNNINCIKFHIDFFFFFLAINEAKTYFCWRTPTFRPHCSFFQKVVNLAGVKIVNETISAASRGKLGSVFTKKTHKEEKKQGKQLHLFGSMTAWLKAGWNETSEITCLFLLMSC